jgi:predicted transposase/invertase (TIGR01784 family)
MEEAKKIDLEEEILDYIFRSRSESRDLVEEIIMGKQKTMTLYERALEEGELKGKLENKLEIARKMQEEGDSIDKILRITGLSEIQLKEHGIL